MVMERGAQETRRGQGKSLVTKIMGPELVALGKAAYLQEREDIPTGDSLPKIATRIRFHAKQTTEGTIAIGKELAKAKQLHSGEFVQWVEHDLGINIRAADSLMAISRKAASMADFSNLPLSVAYLLASPSAPKELVGEKVTAGKKVTVAETKKAIKEEKRKLGKAEKRKAPYAGAKTKEAYTRGFDDNGPYKRGPSDNGPYKRGRLRPRAGRRSRFRRSPQSRGRGVPKPMAAMLTRASIQRSNPTPRSCRLSKSISTAWRHSKQRAMPTCHCCLLRSLRRRGAISSWRANVRLSGNGTNRRPAVSTDDRACGIKR